jgi:Cd2+/Zn2+-exporting ATPase
VLSIPLSYFAGIAKSSKNGLLVKGGEFFDVISNSKSFVFDKTGTITESNLKIKKIVNLTKMSDDDFIDIILAVESYSTHPISKSILNSFDREIKLDLITNLIEHEGMGITCKYNNLDIIIGNNKLLKEHKIFVLKNRIVNICINNNYAGYIEFENKLKENVIDVLKYLKSNKKELILLSGDNKNNFEEIKKLNLFDDIKSELLPNQKYGELKEIIKNNHLNKQTTIYLGDGINDSLSLKGSDCGISMGLVGSDLAVESSDIVITDDNMNKLITLINISNKIRKIVLQNVIFILSIKLLVMILSLFGYANIYLGIIADVGVSLIAILNSIRILK